jgi:hypothetical protein
MGTSPYAVISYQGPHQQTNGRPRCDGEWELRFSTDSGRVCWRRVDPYCHAVPPLYVVRDSQIDNFKRTFSGRIIPRRLGAIFGYSPVICASGDVISLFRHRRNTRFNCPVQLRLWRDSSADHQLAGLRTRARLFHNGLYDEKRWRLRLPAGGCHKAHLPGSHARPWLPKVGASWRSSCTRSRQDQGHHTRQRQVGGFTVVTLSGRW